MGGSQDFVSFISRSSTLVWKSEKHPLLLAGGEKNETILK